jgi:hypothetical protein
LDWLFVACMVILGMLISCILIALRSMSKFEDERGVYIRNKAMANAFKVTIGILVLNVIERIIFVSRNETTRYQERSSIIFLITISIVYLISLLYERRKNGG